MTLIDSHAHLDFYTEDLAAVLARADAAGVTKILAIGIGDGPATMHRALEIARDHSGVFASAGIHPQEAHQAGPKELERLEALVQEPRCVAVGEIGLDYYHVENPDIPTQKEAFRAQMRIAARAGKPILIHCRTSELATPAAKERFGAADAWEDLLELVAEDRPVTGAGAVGGVMHCFSGNVEQARRSVEAGFYLSFAGNVTYPKSVGIREAATWAPADRILVETDAPFLAPVPHRGKQNEPSLVTYTAAAVAELRGVSVQELATVTSENFYRLFPATRSRKGGGPESPA